MDLHRMRVVNFSTPVNSNTEANNTMLRKEKYRNKSLKKRSGDKVYSENRTDIADKLGGGDQTASNDIPKYETVAKRSSFMKRRSNSEVYGIPAKSKRLFLNHNRNYNGNATLRKHLRKNTLSFEDLKRPTNRFSSYFNRDSILNFRLKGSHLRRDKRHRSKKKDPNFRIGREAPNFATSSRKSIRNEGNRQNRKSVGFQTSTCSIDYCIYQMPLRRNQFIISKCSSFMKLRERTKSGKRKKKKSGCSKQISQQTKLRTSTPNNCKELSRCSSLYHVLKYSRYSSHHNNKLSSKVCPSLNKDTAVSTTALGPVIKYDVACGSKNLETSSCKYSRPCLSRSAYKTLWLRYSERYPNYKPSMHKHRKSGKHRSKSKLSNNRGKIASGLIESITSFNKYDRIKNRQKPKIFIKYVFLGLLVVVWSPCLLLLLVAWIVMYPLNYLSRQPLEEPSHIHSLMDRFKISSSNDCHRMRSSYFIPEQKRFFTSIADWYVRSADSAASLFQAILSNLKLKKNRSMRPPAPTRSSREFMKYPNPKNKYKLYYARNRGWVIKPARRRKVGRSTQCEFSPLIKPKRIRKTDSILKQKHSPEVTFIKRPVHPIQRHRSSKFADEGDNHLPYRAESLGLKQKLSPLSKQNFQTNALQGATVEKFASNDYLDAPYLYRTKCDKKRVICVSPKCKNRELRDEMNSHLDYGLENEAWKENPKEKKRIISNLKRFCRKFCNSFRILPMWSRPSPQDEYLPKRQRKPPQRPQIRREYRHKENNKVREHIKGQSSKDSEEEDTNTGVCRNLFRQLAEAEKEAFPIPVTCNFLYIHTLRNKPFLWLYYKYPLLYPYFVKCYRFFASMGKMCIMFLSIFLWAPIIYCCACCLELLLCEFY